MSEAQMLIWGIGVLYHLVFMYFLPSSAQVRDTSYGPILLMPQLHFFHILGHFVWRGLDCEVFPIS